MLKRLLLAGGVLLLFAAVASAPAPTAAAATAAPLSSRVPQAARLIQKVTLGETSIDGPAITSRVDAFEGVVTNDTVIAWTGTDLAHHLNLMRSADNPALGPLRFGQKLTLGETSFVRPAVLQMSPASGNVTILAWTGTDQAHTLNVLWNAYGVPGAPPVKRTLFGETSIGAPALAFWQNGIVLAWTGTDANHSLNVVPLDVGTLKLGAKTILPQFSSPAGPNLSEFSNAVSTLLVFSWTTTTLELNQASSSDGVHFTSALGSGLPQLSAKAPDSLYHQSEGAPEYWLAWTGTDPAHHLNLQHTSAWPQWPNPAVTKTVLGDTALGGPQIAFNQGFLIAWTGTDAAHHLNEAEWEGF